LPVQLIDVRQLSLKLSQALQTTELRGVRILILVLGNVLTTTFLVLVLDHVVCG
jgi:hypothetical protein